MQAEKQHRRREQAGVIDADRVHPFQRHGDIAMVPAADLVVPADVVPAQLVARDAPADVLVADRAAEHRGAGAALCRFDRRRRITGLSMYAKTSLYDSFS
jgi:hypothetical protein